MSAENNHTRILYSRYCHLLKPLTNLECATEALFSKGILTRAERTAVLESGDSKETLCQALTGKGISMLVEVSKILTIQARELKRQSSDEELKRQKQEDRNYSSESDVVTTSSTVTTSSSITTSTSSVPSEEELVGSEGIGLAAGVKVPPLRAGKDTRGSEGSVYEGLPTGQEVYYANQMSSNRDQQPISTSTVTGATTNGKHLKTDVPDPPEEVFTMATTGHVTPNKMEDAFVILFFTYITQQLQTLLPKKTSPDHTYSSPSSQNNIFPWLQVDLPPEEARDYFPSEVIKGVIPNSSDPVNLKLSMLLEGFQQFLRAFEGMKRENVSLQRKGRMYDEISRKYKALEAKMNQMQAGLGQGVPAMGQGQGARDKVIADLKEQLKQVEPLQIAYIRSEERCKQLVEVTQQWAIECDEKLQFIHALEKEAETLKLQIQQLDARVNKYKKFWMENKDLPRGRVSDLQFEDLRSELASRRELYDQVLVQRDEADKKVKALVAELEGLKDHNVQLQDRADNFKVQAQAKEPSVREMSLLLEQKGFLECEVQRLKRENAELSDKTLALEILVQDLTAKVGELRNELPKKKDQSDDWLVVSPTPQRQFSPNPPPAYTRAPHGSQLLAPPTSHTHHTRSSQSSRDEEPEVLSLASSEGGGESGSFSSYESTSGSSERSRPSTFSRSNSGPPSPYRSHDMPLRARDFPHDAPLRARGPPEPSMPHPPPTESQGITHQSHDIKMDPPSSGAQDYTRKIRYPNNSRILVQPLKDEDISLKSEGTGILRARDPPIVQGEKDVSKEPVFCDRSKFDFYQRQYQQQQLRVQNGVANPPPPNQPTALLPPGSALLTPRPNTERKCPMCQHSFLTLSEREFETHVALCRK